MPYKLRKAPKRELYWVIGPDGKHHSKDPIPKERAQAQMRALYAAERREEEARIPTAREEKQIDRKTEGGGPARRYRRSMKTEEQKAIEARRGFPDREDGYDTTSTAHKRLLASSDDLNTLIRNVMREKGYTMAKAKKWIKNLKEIESESESDEEESLHGSGPIPQLSVLQQIAKAAYSTDPPQQIGPFKLRSSTPTLKFYILPDADQRFTDTIIVGIRGTKTTDKQDLWADAQLALGKLEGTPRWTKDLADFRSFMSRIPNAADVDVYGVGHSLGGAILDMFLKKGLIQQGVSYNPAIQLGDTQKDIPNRRIYQEGDPLLAIMGRSARNVEVRPKKPSDESFVSRAARYVIPFYGVYKTARGSLDAHALDNFIGGTHRVNVLKKLGLKDEGYSLTQLAKASRIPRKVLQEVYNRGIGAYATNPTSVRMKGSFKKGVKAPMSQKLSKEQWAMARVYSFIDGNPKHDDDLRGGAVKKMGDYEMSLLGPTGTNPSGEVIPRSEMCDDPEVELAQPSLYQRELVKPEDEKRKVKPTQIRRRKAAPARPLASSRVSFPPIPIRQRKGGVVKKLTDREMKMMGPTHTTPSGQVFPNVFVHPERHKYPHPKHYASMKPEDEKVEVEGSPIPFRKRKGGGYYVSPYDLEDGETVESAYFTSPLSQNDVSSLLHKLLRHNETNKLDPNSGDVGSWVTKFRELLTNWKKDNKKLDFVWKDLKNQSDDHPHKTLVLHPKNKEEKDPIVSEINSRIPAFMEDWRARYAAANPSVSASGRKRGGRMEVATSQPPPPPPPHNRRSCELPYYEPRPRHTLRRGQAEVEFREGDDMEEVLAELPDDAPMVQPIQARLPQRNRSSVRNLGMGKSSAYLRKARANAKAYGLDPKKLTMGEGKHKLSYDGIGFGLKNYNDFLLLSAEEKAGRVPKGTAEKKRKAYLARATKIKGDWKQNKVSPNNLAIHILWEM